MSPLLLLGIVVVTTSAVPPGDVQSTQPAANPITVLSGCLRQSRADTTTANEKGVIYTLEAETQKLPTSPPPEGSGPVTTTGRYALSFEESVDLSKHVNHHVEVRGRMLPKSDTGPSSGSAASKPLPGAAQQMFHVTALKMISPKCQP